MPVAFEDQKKRPPPIVIPAVPRQISATHVSPTKPNQHEQQPRDQDQPVTRNASSSTQQGQRPASSPLTSPLEHDASRYPLPKSGSQKSRASAITNLTDLMGQSREPQNKSAQLTSRAKIEARTEKHMFQISGQLPPTPLANSVGDDEVLIVRQDLRQKCRDASEQQKAQHQEPAKSPKKKLFGMPLPNFGKPPPPAPPMPSKAAQVLGQTPRKPTKAPARPIKPGAPFYTPTKAPRSDTAKSLPAKLLNQDTYARSLHTGAARRKRAVSRRSPPRVNKQPSNAENTPPAPGPNSSFESGPPPTPPAKDTPPEDRATVQPASPLRRTAPSDRLRESYSADVDLGAQLRFPAFALSPSPTKFYHPGELSRSPSKHAPSNADEYKKLIAGQPLPWPSPMRDEPSTEQKGETASSHGGSTEELSCHGTRWKAERDLNQVEQQRSSNEVSMSFRLSGPPQFPAPTDHKSEDSPNAYSHRGSRHYSPLPPRFYSPTDRSVHGFANGETPSKNSDTTRFLYTVASKAALLQPREDSNNGSIEMLYQGNAEDIDPQSSTSRLIHSGKQDTMLVQTRNDSELATRVMQELRVGERQEQAARVNGASASLQPDQSSSRLTDMLNGFSPRENDFDNKFQPNCPSAVPSPLHKPPASFNPMQAMPPRLNSSGMLGAPRTPKTLDDHFFMTNEHLDVVGKSNWDQIETLKKELHESTKHKHVQLVATVENHIQEVKMQVDSVNEKVDRTTEQGHNIHTKLEKLFDFIKDDIVSVLAAQDKKAASMEQSIKELQGVVQDLQKMMEQKQYDAKVIEQHTPVAPVTASHPTTSPFPHQSQVSPTSFYGNMTGPGREVQQPMVHLPDRSSSLAYDGHGDTRVGYGNGYGQPWGPRSAYPGRMGKDDRGYTGTNPYQFSNSAASGSQFSNGYNGGDYSPYNPADRYRFQQQDPTK